ncbi:hypothetical protein ACSSS7_003163 [Eimeria intestinalis]
MWGLSSGPSPLNPKFREVYTCVHGPNGPEYFMQVVPQLAPEGSACWGAPHWGAPQGPLAGEATSAVVPVASTWGSGGPCSKEEEVVLSPQTSICSSACSADFGVSMSPTAEAAGALGGGVLGGPTSAVQQDAAICGAKRRLDLGDSQAMKQQRACGMWHVP